jgi:very-long-chain (3R)-3-hydroxyacyl-CoA dehydratase
MIPMLIAWCLVEVIRYLYLALNMFGIAPRILTWLRYTLFYILYPMGVYGEMKVLIDSMPYLSESQILSITLPNSWNFAFSFASYIWVLVYVIYIPGLYVQYTHMISQRRRALTKPSIGK